MKRSIKFLLSFAIILIAISCSENESLLNPIEDYSQKQVLKLPSAKSSLTLFKSSYSKEIDGVTGGSLEFNYEYESVTGNKVVVNGVLEVPAGAFNYTTTISAVIDEEYATLDFYPSPTTFDQPLILDLEYSGLNLDENSKNADFYFISDDFTNYESIEKEKKEIDINKGNLKVKKALIEHFSRFGWAI